MNWQDKIPLLSELLSMDLCLTVDDPRSNFKYNLYAFKQFEVEGVLQECVMHMIIDDSSSIEMDHIFDIAIPSLISSMNMMVEKERMK